MVEKQTIIHMYRTRGYSKRAISRELDISRKTVHKVISEYESTFTSSDPESSLESVLTTASRFEALKCGLFINGKDVSIYTDYDGHNP